MFLVLRDERLYPSFNDTHSLFTRLTLYCTSPDDDDDFVWPPTGYWTSRKLEEKKGAKDLRHQRAALATTEDAVAGLEGAAKAARYEASFLEAVANRDDLEAKTKALVQAAAVSAKYEASILEQAAAGNHSEKERLLKDKTLPNGGMCAYW